MKLIGRHMEIPNTLCSNVYDFAFCPEPCYDRLVDLADPEDWGPGNRILKNYLSFSFSRAVFLTERDVDQTAPSNLPLVFDDDRCLFNTGLYTRRYETIYGLFEPNTKPDARQRWFLKGFFKESDPMLVSFEYLPCRVRFAEDPSELVFDYRLPIRSNIDHILGDEENLTRIPASLMGEGNSLLLRRAFEGAVVEAARRASQTARLNAAEAAKAVKLAAQGKAEQTTAFLQLEQLKEELAARAQVMQARTRRGTHLLGKGRMLRAYPKLKHGQNNRSLSSLLEQLEDEYPDSFNGFGIQ